MKEQERVQVWVDIEGQLRAECERANREVRYSVEVGLSALEALLAVVDAARGPARYISALRDALEPFAPPEPPRAYSHGTVRTDGRAGEEVDRWNAERDLAVKAAVDATKPNPRDRARDQLADAGVTVQRQFRSDQERIAELESELAEAREEREWAREETKLTRAGRLVALWAMVRMLLVFPVVVVATGAELRGDSELEAKCERLIYRVIRP